MLYLNNTDLLLMEKMMGENKNLTQKEIYLLVDNRSSVAIQKSINSLLYCNVIEQEMINLGGYLKKSFRLTKDGLRLSNLLFKLGK